MNRLKELTTLDGVRLCDVQAPLYYITADGQGYRIVELAYVRFEVHSKDFNMNGIAIAPDVKKVDYFQRRKRAFLHLSELYMGKSREASNRYAELCEEGAAAAPADQTPEVHRKDAVELQTEALNKAIEIIGAAYRDSGHYCRNPEWLTDAEAFLQECSELPAR